MNRKVVMYHAGCVDGFCSALLLKMYFDTFENVFDVLYIPMHYGTPIPKEQLHKDDEVYLVDFSFKRKEMYELSRLVTFIRVIDHHKTAEYELKNLGLENANVYFDSNRSGAKLTEDWIESIKNAKALLWREGVGLLPPATDCSKLVAYVQDRDLWKHELLDTKEISAFLKVYSFDFDAWEILYNKFEERLPLIIASGATILEINKQQIGKAVNDAQNIDFPIGTASRRVKIVNTTVHESEIGNELCQQHDIPFSVTWKQRKDFKFVYSLRSIGDFDVSNIAKAYGGGGHKNAAGFVSDSLVTGLGKCFQKL